MFYNNDPFGFGSHGSSFGSPYERASRRKQQELARRRIIEEERRRRAEYELRQRMEEEKILRQKEQRRREKERSMMEKMKTRFGKSKKQLQPNSSSGRMSTASSYPPGTIVRGPDGNLYRIAAPSRRRWESDDESMASSINNNIERKSSMSCDENKENEEETDTDTCSTDGSMHNDTVMKKDELTYTPSSSESSSLRYDLDNDDSQIKSHNNMYKKDKAAVPLSKIVVVENVPDEEDDELRELHSIWRNRTPSPGQWMEPIESFCG